MLIWSIVLLFVVALVWSIVFKMDEIAIAPAKILPLQEVKKIQPLETAIVESILVREGQTVAKGEPLLRLKVIGANESMEKLQTEYNRAMGDTIRLTALMQDKPLQFFEKSSRQLSSEQRAEQKIRLLQQIDQFTAKVKSLNYEIASKKSEINSLEADLQRLLSLHEPIVERSVKLKKAQEMGYGNAIGALKSQEEAIENQGQTQINQQRILQATAALAALESNLIATKKSFYSDLSDKKAEAESRLNTATNELRAAKIRNATQILTAPVDGVAQQITVHTIGGIVTPAENLMTIVPTDVQLEVVARLENKDIGFVEPNQKAIFKIDSFPFTRFGTVSATVSVVSLDAVKDEDHPARPLVFPIHIRLDKSHIAIHGTKTVPLTAGMTGTVEITTGRRRLISYLLDPIHRGLTQSARER